MVDTYIVATSPDGRGIVLKRGDNYAVVHTEKGIDESTKWRSRMLLSSLIVKASYNKLDNPVKYNPSKIKSMLKGSGEVKKSKSVQKLSSRSTRKKDKLHDTMERMSLQNFEHDLIIQKITKKSEPLLLGLNKSISREDIEKLAEKVHEAWLKTAPESHKDNRPYSELSEKMKEKDRNTVRSVIEGLKGLNKISDRDIIDKSLEIISNNRVMLDLEKAGKAHLPKGSERYAYKVPSEYGIIYIPVNRLKQVYQTDEAINPKKVQANRRKMRAGIPLEPVEIGYNYDIHDGHHRWEASMGEGYTHVPCRVVGSDPEKVKQAKAKYREVWKSTYAELQMLKAVEETNELNQNDDLDALWYSLKYWGGNDGDE